MAQDALEASRWIWIEADPDESNVWAYFRRRLEVQSPHDGWLSITADLRYVVWVNGRMLGFGPPKYHITTPTFDRYPLDKVLLPGTNVFSVLVYSIGNVTDLSSCMPRRGGLLAAIEVDGISVPSDDAWRAKREVAYLKTALRRGEFQPHNEVFDARQSLGEPWRTEYDDSPWPAAKVISQSALMEPWERLEERDIPLIPWHHRPPDRIVETGIASFAGIYEREIVTGTAAQIATAQRRADDGSCITIHPSSGTVELDASNLPQTGGCYARWDFGRLWTGYPVIAISGSPGTTVDLSYAEGLTTGAVDPQKHDLQYFDRLILGSAPLRHRIMWPKCFRYLQIDVRGGKADVQSIALEASHYPVQRRGSFHSSDAVLDQAWEIAAHTLQLCMEDNYMDTPWRERGSWLGDIVPQAHANYYVFGDAALHRRFLIHHARGQMPDGSMRAKYPGNGEHHIPTWSLTFALTLEHYIRHTGDFALAKQLRPTCQRIATWLEGFRTPEGLYGNFPTEVTETTNRYVFIDWAPINTAGANAALNTFAFAFYRSCEQIATLASDTDSAAVCQERSLQLRGAFRSLLWDPGKGVFVNGRDKGRLHARHGVQENYLAVLFGLADQHQRESIVRRLKNEQLLAFFVPDRADYDLPWPSWAIAVNQYRWRDEQMVPLGTPYFAYWATQALCEMGMLQEALDLIRLRWGSMSAQGATSTWEQWNNEGSLSHGWGTAPIIVCGRYVLGVSLSPQDSMHLDIFPQRADLNRAGGRVALAHGAVSVQWRWNGAWELQVVIPARYRATVGLPAEDASAITVNGMPRAATTVRRCNTAFNAIDLGPGCHLLRRDDR